MAKYLFLSLLMFAKVASAGTLSYTCEGIGPDRGSHFDLTVQTAAIQISNNSTNFNAGIYSYLKYVKAKTGNGYLAYNLGWDGNETFSLLLEETLVQNGYGIAKFRQVGEDFSEVQFSCKARK